jgi:hypothetical protein
MAVDAPFALQRAQGVGDGARALVDQPHQLIELVGAARQGADEALADAATDLLQQIVDADAPRAGAHRS